MRARNIKPGFFSNDILAECQPLARILFIGLWCIADREGRLEDRPKKIKAEILPYDDCDIDTLLNELATKTEEDGTPSFIARYKSDGKSYIQILNFAQHQNPHVKEAASIIPALDLHHTSTVLAPDQNSTSPADSLNPITESLLPTTDTSATEQPGNQPDDFNPDELESRRELFNSFEKEFGRTLSPAEYQEITDWLEGNIEGIPPFKPDLILHALRQAALNAKRNTGYIRGILLNWHHNGVKSVQDAEEKDRQFQEQKKKRVSDQGKRASPGKCETTGSEYEVYVPPA